MIRLRSALVFASLLGFVPAARADDPAPPAHVARGNEVEAAYNALTGRLAANHARLKASLATAAPELIERLGATPAPVVYGYQVLPKLIEDPPAGAPARAVSRVYSWAWTRQMITNLERRIETFERQLAPKRGDGSARPVNWTALVDEYRQIEDGRILIDAHYQYNRFWQPAIAADRGRFTRFTELHDAAIERQGLLDRLATAEDPASRTRADAIAAMIHDAIYANLRTPAFLGAVHRPDGGWTIGLPVYTDVRDDAFLERVERVVEARWRVSTPEGELRLDISLRKLDAAQLGALPRDGEHLDISRHAARFPADGAVLTTGANSMYAIPGRLIALGPQNLGETTIAHEFGHLLGFVDSYFRGFHDRGEQGFEVCEVMPDPEDLMSNSSGGKVAAHHYRTVLEAMGKIPRR